MYYRAEQARSCRKSKLDEQVLRGASGERGVGRRVVVHLHLGFELVRLALRFKQLDLQLQSYRPTSLRVGYTAQE